MAHPGQVLKNGRLEVTFVKTAETTGGELLEMDARYGAGSRAPPPHFHPRQEERFQILEGSMRFDIEGVERVVTAGEEVVLPPGTVHRMWNPSDVAARVLWQARPALRSEHFLEATTVLAGDHVPLKGFRRVLQLAAIASHYRDEFRLARRPMRVALPFLGVLGRALGYPARIEKAAPTPAPNS